MESFGGHLGPAGSVSLAVTHDLGDLSQRKVRKAPLSWRVRNFAFNRSRDLPALFASRFVGRLTGQVRIESALRLRKIDRNTGEIVDYGIVSRRVVTDAGVQYLVDALQNLTEPENLKYHGFGTGTNAEAAGDTTLQTELTTQYAVDNTRPTGSLTEGASANIFRTVGTLSPDSGGTIAITEHGIFSASSAGTLLDRSKFSAVNLVAGSDSLQATYELTLASGG